VTLDIDLEAARKEILAAADEAALEGLRLTYLGRSGKVTDALRGLGALPADERRARGQALNEARASLQEAVDRRAAELQASALERHLAAEAVDLTLPPFPWPAGGRHLISMIIDEIEAIFQSLGYDIVEGPEVESEEYNFDRLNIPAEHPARDLWDTFWLEDGRLLRTHTSPMQVRYMERHPPPVKIVVPGKTYRFEQIDATHEAMFHQLEGLVVGREVTFADLKGTLVEMARRLLGADTGVRFLPTFFPFVEPGAELQVWFEPPGGKPRWMELAGCGMVHPAVFAAAKRPEYRDQTGFAFGMGIERLAMARYGIPDIRAFYSNDLRVLRQFRGAGGVSR
jgi:phenylalanyl-tRNA synthetase alpha chain